MALRTSHLTAAGLGAVTDAIRIARDQLAPSPVSGFGRRSGAFDEALQRQGAELVPAEARLQAARASDPPTASTESLLATELVVQGDGYLAVSGDVAGTPGTFFIQRGQFRTNVNGSLVTAGNLALLGRPMLADGGLASTVTPLVIPVGVLPARVSTQLTIAANLDAAREEGQLAGSRVEGPGLSASTEVFDSLGRPQSLKLHFSKVIEGEWRYQALADAHQLEPAEAGGEVIVGEGSLHFSSEGLLQDHIPKQAIDVAFRGTGAVQRIDLGFGDAINQGGSGLSGTTQFSMPSGVASISQNGHPSGTANGFGVAADGTVEVTFSNGQRHSIGQIVVAQFRDNQLAMVSDGVFTQTHESGQAVLGGPGRNGRGSVGCSRELATDAPDEPTVTLRPQRIVATNAQVMAAAADMLSMMRTATVQR